MSESVAMDGAAGGGARARQQVVAADSRSPERGAGARTAATLTEIILPSAPSMPSPKKRVQSATWIDHRPDLQVEA